MDQHYFSESEIDYMSQIFDENQPTAPDGLNNDTEVSHSFNHLQSFSEPLRILEVSSLTGFNKYDTKIFNHSERVNLIT